MYVCICMFVDRLRTHTDTHGTAAMHGGNRALLPPRSTLGRPCFRTRQRVGASDLLRTSGASAIITRGRGLP